MNLSILELIDIVRTETENLDVTELVGIKDEEIIRYLNIAQRQLQSKIVGRSPKEFSIFATLTKTNVADKMYNMPIDCFMRSKITSLWVDNNLQKQTYVHNISPDNDEFCGSICTDYYYTQETPEVGYAIVGNKVYLTGKSLQSNAPKVFYVQTLPELNKTIADIDLITAVDMQGGVISLTPTSDIDPVLLKTYYKYSLVNEEGEQVVKNLRIASYDSLTRQITLSTKNDSEIVTSTEILYLVRGANASTHSDLEPLATDFLTRYAIGKILQRDGSSEYNVHSADLVSLLQEVIDAYSLISDDVMSIPQFPED